MPTEIDDLRIKINAQADTANAAIDNLVDKLDSLTSRLGKIDGGKLTGLANGVSAFGNAVKLVGSVDKRNFDKLAANITKIASIDTASINRAASSMNQLRIGLNSLGSVSQNAVQISEIAANISKLGGKNVTNAITNLPLLTTELNKFMSVMANSPQVSRNIIDMTNALANLAGQGRNVGAATSTLTNGLNKGNKSIARTSKSTTSLASAFGRFYATYFLVIRSIKGLWGSIGKTADYFEAFNYFNVAFDKIAGEWSQDFEKYGYDNAEAYAESFTSRMEDTFSKLSGVEFNAEKGLLSETGTKNLGMNIQEITQYASQLASVTNSLKLTGEASLATSTAFTKLAGDMSSLFNVDYADVSANLQSGLIGQSRALYKYGIDITNATLQTKAYELGLSKAVSEMTQGEKAQLRLLSILEQSKVAWGDQANTINSLSNQMRLLKNGWSETSMVFGQLFVPLLENALPIVNGMVIALKRLLINVAGFMGVKIDPNKFNTGLNNSEEVLDGIASGFEDAAAAAKEYENQILGFDEITKLQDTTATVGVSADGSGIDLTAQILDATSEYEKVWNEAYNNMENRANEWADAIGMTFVDIASTLSSIGNGISEFFKPVGEIFNTYVVSPIQELASIHYPNLSKAYGAMFETLSPLTDFLANAFASTWSDIVSPKLSFLSNTIIPTLISAYENLWNNVLTPLVGFLQVSFGPAFEKVSEIMTILWKNIVLPLSDTLKNVFETAFVNIATVFNTTVIPMSNNLIDVLTKLWKNVLNPIADVMWTSIKPIFEKVMGAIGRHITNLGNILSGAINLITGTFTGDWKKAWNGVKDIFVGVWDNIKTAVSTVWQTIQGLFSAGGTIFVGLVDGIASVFTKIVNKIIEGINNVIAEPFETINGLLNDIRNIKIFNNKPFSGLWDNDPLAIPVIPTFATGGFPEDGLFMANHNELVGQFSNGRTAVANNEQITQGIANAVGPAVYEAVLSAMQSTSNGNGDITINIDGKRVFRVMREQAHNYTMQTGKPAF